MGDIVTRLRKLMKEKGITTDKELVDLQLISKNTIRNWEKGMKPQKATVQHLAQYFNVSTDYLLGKSDSVYSNDFSQVIPYELRGKRPIVGNVSAGMGIIADEDIIGWADVNANCNNDNYFWLRVSGDSMSPRIDNGDLILINKAAHIENGNIVVVLIDNEGFIKKVHFEDNAISFVSYNPYYPPMRFGKRDFERIRFVGKVIKQERDL